jgi:hypothetical protein
MNRTALLAHLTRLREARAPATDEVDSKQVGTPIAQAVASLAENAIHTDGGALLLPPAHAQPLLP